MKANHKVLLGAAVAGLMSAATMAHAEEAKKAAEAAAAPAATTEKMGKCVAVNGCKTQSACAVKTKHVNNSCKGQNGCGGKGFVEMTKADCTKKMDEIKAMAKKDKKPAPKGMEWIAG